MTAQPRGEGEIPLFFLCTPLISFPRYDIIRTIQRQERKHQVSRKAMTIKEKIDWLRTPGKRPWRLVPTREKTPVRAVVYDAENRLVVVAAYGNAALIVKAVNSFKEEN